jgi:hypothetical protein
LFALSVDADIVLKLSGATCAKIHLNAKPVGESIQSGGFAVTKGDAAEAARVLELFDAYDPARAVVVPPSVPDQI